MTIAKVGRGLSAKGSKNSKITTTQATNFLSASDTRNIAISNNRAIVWILLNGIWDDNGIWGDENVWID